MLTMQDERKRKLTDSKMHHTMKKHKLSESDNSDKKQSNFKSLSKHKKKKRNKHSGSKENPKSGENIVTENMNESQESHKDKTEVQSKDSVHVKKNKKKKHSKNKIKKTATPEKVKNSAEKVEKVVSETEEVTASVSKEKGNKKRKHSFQHVQSQLERKSNVETSDNIDKEMKNNPVKKHKKRKRKLKEDSEGTDNIPEKQKKLDAVKTPNKNSVISDDMTENSGSKFAKGQKGGKDKVAGINSAKKLKTPLTDRQKHKRWKLKQRRKLKRLSKDKKTDQNELEVKGEKERSDASQTRVEGSNDSKQQAFEKVVLPKGPEEVSANWKKLQTILETKKTEKEGKKTKHKPHPFRRGQTTDSLDLKKTRVDEKELTKTDEKRVPDIWFDDVDEIYLEPVARSKPAVPLESENEPEHSSQGEGKKSAKANPLIKPDAYKGLTKVVSMDCEMVGVGDGKDNMLARVSIVNQFGEMVYDKFVKPVEDVVDYRTHVSGVRKEDIEKGEEFTEVQKEVARILKGRLLVGHAIMNDLKVLYLSHPRKRIRDTSRYKPFRQLFQGRNPSLKKLSAQVLKVNVQEGEHNSVQDAQAAMRLYTMYRKQWEAEIGRQQKKNKEKMKDKQLPVVEALIKKSVFQKKRNKSVLDKRKTK